MAAHKAHKNSNSITITDLSLLFLRVVMRKAFLFKVGDKGKWLHDLQLKKQQMYLKVALGI